MTYPPLGPQPGAQPWQPPQQAAPGFPPAGYGQWGYAQPGYGQPGYGQLPGYPAPKSSGPKWALVSGLAAIIVVGIVVGAFLYASSGGGLSALGGRSDEDQIRSLVSSGSSSIKDRACANDLKLFSNFPDVVDATGATPSGPKGTAPIDRVNVTGDTATAEVTATLTSGLERADTLYFRKEGGEWKICFTDSPQMKWLQQLPGMK
ncbi:hypothetical protein FZI85_00685 [Mycobacterium sp. CBMA293]|uniref:Rv0361 family membrane protein n=1 Tax=unclassified Mycolicibacterium TaxID=2636767 RepID=UPI0012DFE205|nr:MULTISPECIES: nuclear transport factor 2 family protein [unclassified Mycolicibacterium]MUL45066.1 hypothetical protein [Mycolicibacterium sp. CBMA 360]MUL57821.1 hypothetical protein [Mycolicibacterium sp. CBMA 335]MUL72730.1 hypothetical protein [Mycolicibacterium sp. CBMA 311]MUL97363.1 hypothetical protein [Mycolicibacterium sp. CBMA 230]MUM07251.1 hypothetical protein [Mycolicibacterium sp. CBMA 213]